MGGGGGTGRCRSGEIDATDMQTRGTQEKTQNTNDPLIPVGGFMGKGDLGLGAALNFTCPESSDPRLHPLLGERAQEQITCDA